MSWCIAFWCMFGIFLACFLIIYTIMKAVKEDRKKWDELEMKNSQDLKRLKTELDNEKKWRLEEREGHDAIYDKSSETIRTLTAEINKLSARIIELQNQLAKPVLQPIKLNLNNKGR